MGKRQKVTLENLSSVIKDVFNDIEDATQDGVNKAIHRAALDGVKALKSESKNKVYRTGKYAAGWRTFSETNRVTGQSETLHNAAKPTLVHLLEYGHAKRGGGRVEGRPHVKPVEEELVRSLPESIAENIESNLRKI